MKPSNVFRAATLIVAAVAMLFVASLPLPSRAQTVTQLPAVISNNGTVYDFGNGPLELKIVQGQANIFTMSGSGVGSTSGSATLLTLTSTAAATPPCVGCIISGTGITSGTTAAAFNGTTGITLSAAMTVAASTSVAWGRACPTTTAGQKLMQVQAGVTADLPLYTQARICAGSQFSAGAIILPFAIGAH